MSFDRPRDFALQREVPMTVDPSDRPAADPHPTYRAEDLTKGTRIAQIQHGDQVYTLRITKAEKLILTK